MMRNDPNGRVLCDYQMDDYRSSAVFKTFKRLGLYCRHGSLGGVVIERRYLWAVYFARRMPGPWTKLAITYGLVDVQFRRALKTVLKLSDKPAEAVYSFMFRHAQSHQLEEAERAASALAAERRRTRQARAARPARPPR